MQDILKFIVSFADIPVVPARPHGQPRRQQQAPSAAAGAAAGSSVEAGVAEIEAKLHRQGLREKVSKGACCSFWVPRRCYPLLLTYARTS
jgi:hypothetical protein